MEAIKYIINKHKKYILNLSNNKNLALQYRRIARMCLENNNVKMYQKGCLDETVFCD